MIKNVHFNVDIYNRGRTGKIPAGISGQAGNTRELSMVKIFSDCLITGACHAPVDSRQGEV